MKRKSTRPEVHHPRSATIPEGAIVVSLIEEDNDDEEEGVKKGRYNGGGTTDLDNRSHSASGQPYVSHFHSNLSLNKDNSHLPHAMDDIYNELHGVQSSTQPRGSSSSTTSAVAPASSTPTTCSICWEENFDVVELRVLSCNHRFHKMCVEHWLHIKPVCPLCKKNCL